MTSEIISGKELLKRAIKSEQDGRRFYTFLAEKATNEEAKRKLSHLAADESRHEATVIGIYKTIYNEEVGELPEVGVNALAQIFNDSEAKGRGSEMQFIELAIEAELAATNFYKEFAKNNPDEKVKKICEDLATEEYQHFELLQAEKDALGGNYYWFAYDEGSPMED